MEDEKNYNEIKKGHPARTGCPERAIFWGGGN
jgi:hypothetical protein